MAKDPYRYYRIEARELLEGLTRGILDLEKGGVQTETVRVLLRLAHTFKGASRVVKQARISEISHTLEEILAPYRDGASAVPKNRITEMLHALDAISAALSLLEPSRVAPESPRKDDAPMARLAVDEPLETVRVGIGEMDKLLEGLAEISAQLAAVKRDAQAVHRAGRQSSNLYDQLSGLAKRTTQGITGAGVDTAVPAHVLRAAEELRVSLGTANDTLAAGVEQLGAELFLIREAAHQLRLVPASVVFAPLERTARDAAQALQKSVRFEAGGGETRLDAHVLAALRDALMHVVRNAVAHGIEPEEQRRAEGKPPTGTVALSVERRGNRAAIVCRDDGKGIDVAAIRKAIVQRGLFSAEKADALSLDDVIQTILKGGVTTTGIATEVSGRGIGLDAVRATAARLKGTVAIRTERGRGTSVEICVPISLASLMVLRVESAGVTASIPLDSVIKTMRVEESDLARSSNGVSLVCDGHSIAYVSLSDLFRGQGEQAHGDGARGRNPRSVVIVESAQGQGRAALGVERLLGAVNTVVRPLPPMVQAEAFITGASLDVDGNPELILDPLGIVAAANAAVPAEPAIHPADRPPILVIDDSLTTRMLEQSILESAGYKVELAVSAEEALEKTRLHKYGIFIVDVEMPGMDGFEFVEHVRSDPNLRDIPCILVTSRNAPEDRLRGQKAGARAYIVKSEFNQDFLLQTIRGLLG